MDDQIKQILIDFFQQHPSQIYGIWIGGSAAIPYIQHPDDIDIIINWNERHVTKEDIEERIALRHQIREINNNYNMIHRYVMQYHKAFEQQWPVYIYLYRYNVIIAGELYPLLDQFDILKYPQKVWDSIADWIEKLHHNRNFYHILTCLYILINESYELTEEQIANINIVHDQQDQEKIEELYQWALQQIQE